MTPDSHPRRLPTVVLSSVIRSSHQGESHGGVYLLDVETGHHEQVLDWNDPAIDWSGRGGDRGLRGIAFYGDSILCAASDEIFVFDRNFKIRESYRNRYLKHCHEIFVEGDDLYMTSTGFDSVLVMDLRRGAFTKGYRFRQPRPGPRWGRVPQRIKAKIKPLMRTFDPTSSRGPAALASCHLNQVMVAGGRMYVCGTQLRQLLEIEGNRARIYGRVPTITHNAQPYEDGKILANHSAADAVKVFDRQGVALRSLPIVHYPQEDLVNGDLPQDKARQAHGRGLIALEGGIVIGGSSPATISVYDLAAGTTLKTMNLTMDVRNSIHGLEVWPF
jgi:hypothetical protein